MFFVIYDPKQAKDAAEALELQFGVATSTLEQVPELTQRFFIREEVRVSQVVVQTVREFDVKWENPPADSNTIYVGERQRRHLQDDY